MTKFFLERVSFFERDGEFLSSHNILGLWSLLFRTWKHVPAIVRKSRMSRYIDDVWGNEEMFNLLCFLVCIYEVIFVAFYSF